MADNDTEKNKQDSEQSTEQNSEPAPEQVPSQESEQSTTEDTVDQKEPETEPKSEPEPEQVDERKPEKEPEKEPESEPKSEPETEPETEPKEAPEKPEVEEVTDESEVQEVSETPESEEPPEPKEDKSTEKAPEPEEKPKPTKGKKSGKQSEKPEAAETVKEGEEQKNPDFKYIIRVANTNVDGNSTIPQGLTDIKGLGIRLGIAITDKLGLPRNKKIGDMTDDEVEKLIELVDKIDTEFPGWMKNRQKDFETGEDLHIISSEIQRSLRDDLNLLKKIRCYRGIRHEQGQKVRGQRTRANGRSGMTVGVMRKKVQQTQKKK